MGASASVLTAKAKGAARSRRSGTAADGAGATVAAKPAAVSAFYAAGPALSLGGLAQAKLKVGQANDPYEREADVVAERVATGQPAPAISAIPPGALTNLSPWRAEETIPKAQDRVRSPPAQRQAEATAERPENEEKELETPPAQRQADKTEAGAEERLDEEQPPQPVQRQAAAEEKEPKERPAEEQLKPAPAQRQVTEPLTEKEEEASANEELQTCRCDGTCPCGTGRETAEERPEIARREGESRPQHALIQTKPQAASAVRGAGVAAADDAIRRRGAGEPLKPSVQRAIEAQTGLDMSAVRVHRDNAAHAASRTLRARAFTQGRDIWLGPGESPADLKLMAHEATHVVQQGAVAERSAPFRPTVGPSLQKNRAETMPSLPAPVAVVQRAVYRRMDNAGVLLLQIPFGDDLITHFVVLDTETAPYFEGDAELAQNIEDELGRIFNPETQPLHETAAYLNGPAIKQLIERGIRALRRTGGYDFSDLAQLLQQRTALFYAQNLLPAATAWLADQLHVQPAEIDWNALLPALQTRAAALEPVTLIDASLRDRYSLFLDMLAAKAAALPPVVGAAAISPALADFYLLWYVSSYGSQLFTKDVFTHHSEKFLEEYLPLLEAIRYVPADFELESFRPLGYTGAIDARREAIIADFIKHEVPGRVVLYILNCWTESGQSPGQFLGSLDLEDFRADLVTYLARILVNRARQAPDLMAALRSRAFDQARFTTVAAIYYAGVAIERRNSGLQQTFATVPLDEVSAEDYAIAADPHAYYESKLAIADVLRVLLSRLSPNGPIETQVLQAGIALLQAQDIPSQYAFIFLLPELLDYLGALKSALEQQERETQRALEERLELDWATITETVWRHAEYADRFIRERWLPTLKRVALDRLAANRDEIQTIYDNLEVANAEFIARLTVGADEFELLAQRLEEESYESIEMEDRTVTRDDVGYLRQTARFMRAEAEARTDPDRLEQQRAELQEALDVYDTVREDIQNDKYDPLDYSREIYQEARQRLGIGEFPAFTTVGMVLTGEATAEQNPFLAQAIVGWRWREGVERQIETSLLLGGLMILTVAAMLTPGVGGLILGVIDIGVGVGMGVHQIADAYELLNMARLDIHRDIRGVSVEEAERALRHAWIGLGVTIVLTAGPLALSRALRVRGGGIELPPAVRQWEEGLSTETRALLRSNPGLRRTFAEMSPAVRRILTHCSTICIPPIISEADKARIEAFLPRAQRLRGRSGTFGDVHEWIVSLLRVVKILG